MSLSIGAGTQRQRVSSHVPETGVATFSIEGWALQWCLPTWHNREAVRDSHRSIFFLWRRRSTRLYHFLCSKHNGHQRYLPRHEQWVHRRSYAGPARVRRPCGRGWGGGERLRRTPLHDWVPACTAAGPCPEGEAGGLGAPGACTSALVRCNSQ